MISNDSYRCRKLPGTVVLSDISEVFNGSKGHRNKDKRDSKSLRTRPDARYDFIKNFFIKAKKMLC